MALIAADLNAESSGGDGLALGMVLSAPPPLQTPTSTPFSTATNSPETTRC